MKKVMCFIMIMGLLTLGSTAIAKTYTVKVTTISGKAVKITKFQFPSNIMYYSKTDTLCVIWKESQIFIKVSDLKTIEFGKGKNYDRIYRKLSDVKFKDGSKDKFWIMVHYNHTKTGARRVFGQSKYGSWSVDMLNIKKIEFLSSGSGSTNTKVVVNIKTDNIQLKNGDTISGTILTKTIKLKTSYGSLDFKLSDISLIDFEGDMDNVDRITLKVGDQLSGVILNEDIDVEMINGSKITVIKDKIKTVSFKE